MIYRAGPNVKVATAYPGKSLRCYGNPHVRLRENNRTFDLNLL